MELNGTAPPRTFRTKSYEPPGNQKPHLPPKKLSLKNPRESPRKPRKALPLFDGSPKMNLGLSGGIGAAPTSPRRSKDKVDIELEEQLEEIKRRMGILTLRDGKQYRLTSIEDIEIVRKIGNGICGEVFLMRHKASRFEMAAKKMVWLDDQEERKRIQMDLHVMMSHKSPHIVQYFGSAIWNNEVWVFMELMATCLDRLLKRLKGPIPEDVVCTMAVSIVKALAYLKERHSVIHRDVKPSNMLLDRDGTVKLCDFGISGRLVDSQAFTRNAGCAAYMAPERINLQPGNTGYDIRADIWSLGISLVELATGSLPYNAKTFGTEFELLTYIVEAPPPLPDKTRFSPNFYDFVAKCLTKDVLKRPHYNDLLQHPLITEYSEKPVDIAEWFAGVVKTHGMP